MKMLKKCVITILIILSIIISSMLIYFEIYYHAEESIKLFLESNEKVSVSKIEEGYLFDGKGVDTLFIFYPGAKVQTEAYAKFMNSLAENGIDCVLLDIPFRFAFLGKNKADKIIEKYDYKNICISGHSLGGVVATMYAKDSPDKINSIVLLASYPTLKINDNIKLLSIYGNKDGVLAIDKYEESKINWPHNNKEVVIEGANHAGVANYGEQKGDNMADITNEEQQKQTIENILHFIYED